MVKYSREKIERIVINKVAEAIEIPVTEISCCDSFVDLGADSFALNRLAAKLNLYFWNGGMDGFSCADRDNVLMAQSVDDVVSIVCRKLNI